MEVRLLVQGQNQQLVKLLEERLPVLGYKLEFTDNPASADLLFFSGFSANDYCMTQLRKLRSKNKGIAPIIALSSPDGGSEPSLAMLAGLVGIGVRYLDSPTPDHLMVTADSLLRLGTNLLIDTSLVPVQTWFGEAGSKRSFALKRTLEDGSRPVVEACCNDLADQAEFCKHYFGGRFGADGIRVNSKRSICYSTQASCGRDCKFCASGALRRSINLEPQEMVDQVLLTLLDSTREPEPELYHIAAEGIGEVLDNVRNTVIGWKRLNKLLRGNLAISFSTLGVVSGWDEMIEFIVFKQLWNLSIKPQQSIHSVNRKWRSRYMPGADPLHLTLPRAVRAADLLGQPLVLNFHMSTSNNTVRDAKAAVKVITQFVPPILGFDWKISPFNGTRGGLVAGNSDEFVSALRALGIQPRVVKSMGPKNAFCGQFMPRILPVQSF